MGDLTQKPDKFENSNTDNLRRDPKDIIREIVDYSFQKDAYLGHRIEGGFLIAYLVEKARELQFLKEGGGIKELNKENTYIGIAVHSASDLSFIKDLIVTVTILDAQGFLIGKHQHLYHPRPGLHNYGRNWVLPGDGLYTVSVEIDARNLPMVDKLEHNLSAGIVEVEFPQVMIQTGRHIS